jgi:hypothetical protein
MPEKETYYSKRTDGYLYGINKWKMATAWRKRKSASDYARGLLKIKLK